MRAISEYLRHNASWRGFQPAEFCNDTSAPEAARDLAAKRSFKRTARWRGVSR